MTTQNAPDIPGFTYLGDVDILYGGKYISDQDGEIIEVISASDLDGEEYLVIQGYMFLERKLSEWRRVIDSAGWIEFCNPRWRSLPREWRRLCLKDAMCGYWGYDTDRTIAIPCTDDDAVDYAAVVAALNELT